ncbi:MAG: hypothetical protein J0L75_06425 [Spirochaetes bacterium]|nr:hypothetical protein [Spirochaetota bacterium]
MAFARRFALALILAGAPLAALPFDGLLSTNRAAPGDALTVAFPLLTRSYQIQFFTLASRHLATQSTGAEERRDRLYVTVRLPTDVLPGPIWVRLKTDRYDRRAKLLVDAP